MLILMFGVAIANLCYLKLNKSFISFQKNWAKKIQDKIKKMGKSKASLRKKKLNVFEKIQINIKNMNNLILIFTICFEPLQFCSGGGVTPFRTIR